MPRHYRSSRTIRAAEQKISGIGSAEIKKSIKRRQYPISAGSPTIRFTFEKTIGLRAHDVAIKGLPH
jgi:hypothetical protein